MKLSDSFVETFAKVLPPVKMSKMSSLLPSSIPCHWQVHPPHLCQWPKIGFTGRRSSEDGELMILYFALLAPNFPGPQLGKAAQMASFKLCNCILLHLPLLQLFLLQPVSMWHWWHYVSQSFQGPFNWDTMQWYKPPVFYLLHYQTHPPTNSYLEWMDWKHPTGQTHLQPKSIWKSKCIFRDF